jgi:hypothetical protein
MAVDRSLIGDTVEELRFGTLDCLPVRLVIHFSTDSVHHAVHPPSTIR